VTATSTRQGLWFEPRPAAGAKRKPARPRDSQRSRLYAAEAGLVMFRQEFETLEACQAYLLAVLCSRKFQGRWGRRSAAIVAKHRGAACVPNGSSIIRLPRWAWRSDVILHELAHVLTPKDAGHGREYAACYLKLVAMFLGPSAEKNLREGYRREKVRWCKRRKVSPEQRAAMAARFLELRARGFAAKPGA